MKAPLSVSKPADLGVGGPELWILGSMVTKTKETMFYPGLGPLYGGKTLRPALVYIDEVSRYRVDLPRDHMLWSKP
jgi:hypothetical protein